MTSGPVRVLNKRYVLEEALGRGGMGSVWKAYDTLLERTVAAKELISGIGGGEDRDVSRERVRRETLALAKVEHPAIVSVHDLIFDGHGRDPWIVMAYVRGRSLEWLIREVPPLSDQKVANIVIGDDGAVRLVDFGVARIHGMNPLTSDSQLIGTPGFQAPELLSGRPPGPETDFVGTGRDPSPRPWTAGPRSAPTHGARRWRPSSTGTCPSRAPAARSPRWSSTCCASTRRTGPMPTASPWPCGPSPPAVSRADRTPVRTRTAGRAGAGANGGSAAQPGPSRRPGDADPPRPGRRLTPLSGLPVFDAAKIISGWPTDRAVADLLSLEESVAATIISRCADPVAGTLLSAIAADRPP